VWLWSVEGREGERERGRKRDKNHKAKDRLSKKKAIKIKTHQDPKGSFFVFQPLRLKKHSSRQ